LSRLRGEAAEDQRKNTALADLPDLEHVTVDHHVDKVAEPAGASRVGGTLHGERKSAKQRHSFVVGARSRRFSRAHQQGRRGYQAIKKVLTMSAELPLRQRPHRDHVCPSRQ